MALVPEDAFETLLADRSPSAVAAFVADLWRARGFDARREDERLLVDDRELLVVSAVDAVSDPPDDGRLVTARTPPAGAPDAVLGPEDLREMLLYDVERERAAELFERHFDCPLDGDWSGRRWLPDALGGGRGEDGDDDDAPPTFSGVAALRRMGRRVAGAVPRDRAEVEALLRSPRTLGAVLAVLVVLAGGAWTLGVHEPAPEAPGEQPFARGTGAAPGEGSFRMVATVRITTSEALLSSAADPEGTFYYWRTRTYAPGDPAVASASETFGQAGDGTTITVFERGDRSYSRWRIQNASRYHEFRARETRGLGPVVAVNATRTVYTARRAASGVEQRSNLRLGGIVLRRLPYERAGTTTYEGREAVRYVPTTGWVTYTVGPDDDLESARVGAASGELLVDAGTGALLYADVEATSTPGDTWADVLTGPSSDLSVEYDVERGVARPQAPPWVDGLEANLTVTNATAGRNG